MLAIPQYTALTVCRCPCNFRNGCSSSGSPHCQPPHSCQCPVACLWPSLISPTIVAARQQSPTIYQPPPPPPPPPNRKMPYYCVCVCVCVCVCLSAPLQPLLPANDPPQCYRPPTALPISRSDSLAACNYNCHQAGYSSRVPTPCNPLHCPPVSRSTPLQLLPLMRSIPALPCLSLPLDPCNWYHANRSHECPNMSNDC